MPTYDYVCKDCGHHLSAEQRMTDSRLTDCPSCGKPSLERVLSASGFALKGSGWYRTDGRGARADKKDDTPLPPCAGGACSCH